MSFPVSPETLAVFIPVALALNLTPGADMLFSLGQGARSGPAAGVAAAAGISAGSLVHATAAGVGLAALIAAHPLAFEVVRWAGVAYLVWLALRAFADLARGHGLDGAPSVAPMRPLAAFRAGLLVNLLNPKVGIFVLALVPQFVRPEAGSILGQFLVFGAVLGIGGMAINGAVGLSAGHVGRALARSRRMSQALQAATGTIFLALAARLALQRV
ncbi:LysE family translocator [Albimonas sp. CAU 1670]|uniref:LysE family translocator n=1 Tax=Albimonas sp. CAU 1670 TaxID=3032599 RepID=UPI0023DC921A|nr:LysE family translocator [Albimonas sp. CAU 1670]MDF2232661.1 LysE family translocator [Albimonas sp. CAU 1670]